MDTRLFGRAKIAVAKFPSINQRRKTEPKNCASSQVSRWRVAGSVFACAVFAMTLTSAPIPAVAAETNYLNSPIVMNTWAWSGYHTMTGAKAWGDDYPQWLMLQNDGDAMVQGYSYIWTDHASRFTVSKCGWYNSLVHPGTKAMQTCRYTH